MPLVSAKCTACGSVLSVDTNNNATICPYCREQIANRKAILLFNESFVASPKPVANETSAMESKQAVRLCLEAIDKNNSFPEFIEDADLYSIAYKFNHIVEQDAEMKGYAESVFSKLCDGYRNGLFDLPKSPFWEHGSTFLLQLPFLVEHAIERQVKLSGPGVAYYYESLSIDCMKKLLSESHEYKKIYDANWSKFYKTLCRDPLSVTLFKAHWNRLFFGNEHPWKEYGAEYICLGQYVIYYSQSYRAYKISSAYVDIDDRCWAVKAVEPFSKDMIERIALQAFDLAYSHVCPQCGIGKRSSWSGKCRKCGYVFKVNRM